MGLTLSTADLARLDAASRTLLAPLAAPSPEAWLREAGVAVRDLVGLDALVLLLPNGASYFSDDAPEVVAGAAAYTEAHLATGTLFSDPVVRLWHEMRRAGGHEAFSFALNAQMVGERGYGIEASPLVSDVLIENGYRDFAGLLTTTTTGDAMVWALGRSRPPGADPVPLLRVLVPSFRSGLDALGRLGAHRAALDAVDEPLAVVDADGRERHRNGALVRLLDADPERIAVEAALSLLAADLRRLAFPRWGEGAAAPAPLERHVRTARGRYTLRAAVVPPGAFGPGETALVSVAADRAPALPDAGVIRERFGLTAREAEVALLIAEGLPNDAVADRLFVAPKTARRHTEGVLAKLEVAGRAAVLPKLLGAA